MHMSVQVLTVVVEVRGGSLVSCSVTVPFSLRPFSGFSLNLGLAFWVCGAGHQTASQCDLPASPNFLLYFSLNCVIFKVLCLEMYS